MKTYLEGIECTRYVDEIESCTTSGDLDYLGTALEISEKNGNELFILLLIPKEGSMSFFILS